MKVFKSKITKRTALCLSAVAVLATADYGVHLAHIMVKQQWEHFRTSLSLEKSILAEMLVKQQVSSLDSLPHHVLCIGNSITLHLPLDDVNWYSSQGMAASKPEYDYCHMLEKMMRQHNPETTVTPVNLASWERDFSINIDSLLKAKCKEKDIIVIRIGENIQKSDIPQFANALSKLIGYCLQYTDNILLTGLYWPAPDKEHAIVRNAHHYHLKYVPIDWIWNLYREECSPKEGDTLYYTDGKPYQIKGNFIITHPNDKGMELIARTIYNAL